MALDLHPVVRSAAERALANQGATREEALALGHESIPLEDLLYAADRVRRTFFGDTVTYCSIVNAKSGKCSEDCGFCAQASRFKTDIPVYRMLPEDEIVAAAKEAAKNGSKCFGLVTATRGPKEKDLRDVERALGALRDQVDIRRGASLGLLTREAARRLKAAGLEMAHHNLETSKRFFPKVCTSHTWEERRQTLDNIREAGLLLCSGVIFGLGEEWEDRVDVLFELKEVRPDNIPVNFLRPIAGTPLGDATPIAPQDALRSLAMARLVLPDRPLAVCGGREHNLRDLQSWIYRAGATGTMVGNYLTTLGRDPAEDRRMTADLGLRDRVG